MNINHTYTSSDAHNADWHFTIHRTRWQRFLGWLADRGGGMPDAVLAMVLILLVGAGIAFVMTGDLLAGVLVIDCAWLFLALVAKDKRTRGEV